MPHHPAWSAEQGAGASASRAEQALTVLGDCLEHFFAHYAIRNRDPFVEDGEPCVAFDVVQLLSDCFALQIHPVLRGGELSAVVGIVHLRDGLGAASQDYAVLNDLQDDVESEADETLEAWAGRCIEQACKLHACRIEHYGVQPEQVREIYRRFWIRRSIPTRLPIWQPVFSCPPGFLPHTA